MIKQLPFLKNGREQVPLNNKLFEDYNLRDSLWNDYRFTALMQFIHIKLLNITIFPNFAFYLKEYCVRFNLSASKSNITTSLKNENGIDFPC